MMTIGLFWTLTPLLFNLEFLPRETGFYFFIILFILFVYFYRTQLYDLFLVLFKPVLNTCEYCKEIRVDNRPYLVNGQCKNCKTHICAKCFNYRDPNHSNGCPICGRQVFVRNTRLGYRFRLPNLLKKVTKPILRTCKFCKTIREEKKLNLVNGYCENCGAQICSKCFHFQNNRGCPVCEGHTFIWKTRLRWVLTHSPKSSSDMVKLNEVP